MIFNPDLEIHTQDHIGFENRAYMAVRLQRDGSVHVVKITATPDKIATKICTFENGEWTVSDPPPARTGMRVLALD